MKRALVPVLLAGVASASCGNGESQSLGEGMRILCASDEEAGVETYAPAERQAQKSTWIDARLKNKEVRAVFERIGALPPQERVTLLMQMVEKAQLKGCDALDHGAAGVIPPDVLLPELGVAAAGAVPLDDRAPMITVIATSSAIVMEGTSVVPLQGMLPDDKQLRTALSNEIVKVGEMAKALAAERQASGKPLAGARLLVRPDAPYQLLVQLMSSIKVAGLKRFDIVARRDGQPVAVPIELPEMKRVATAEEMAAPQPVGLVVAMTKTNMIVFSLSGREGTIQAPSLSTGGISSADIARVQAALMEVRTRHTDERRVLVMADASINMQLVTELLAAVRATPDGGKLFTDVTLGTAFE